MEVFEVEYVKEEPDWESPITDQAHQSLLEGLYADHEVKEEIVLGPELLQQEQPPTYAVEVTVKIEDGETYKEEAVQHDTKPNKNNQKHKGADTDENCLSRKDLFPLKNCFVMIDPMILHKEQYICTICKKTYSQKSSLTYHMRTHTKKDYKMKNKISNETTEQGSKRKTPVKEPSVKRFPFLCAKDNIEKKPHKCDVCGKQFKLKALLVNHYRIHTGETPYSCTICNRRFTELVNLKRHERTHTGEKPFSCELCKKQFALKCNLIFHLQSHTKVKPYSCDICNRLFVHKSVLKKHKETHAAIKRFSCKICEKGYTRKYRLVDHMRTHSKEEP